MSYNPVGFYPDGYFPEGYFPEDAGGDAATFVGPSIGNLSFVIDVAITPIDFSTRFTGTGLTFAVIGTLPTGLSLNSAGVLSGTPTVEQVASGLVIRATDAALGTADSNTFNITIADVVLSVYPRWMPMELALKLSWLRRYEGMRAAALAEANASALWAKFALYRNVRVDVHSVPGYPRPNWPIPGG